MKVMLIKDVYKLGHAGDVKKVAAGYGRNYLIPQGLAVLATPGALKQADRIREEAAITRANLNQELSGVADILGKVQLTFPARAGEADKLYGSITHRMIADALTEESGVEISHKQIDSQPIRTIGIHSVNVRLTVDLVPEVQVVVYREGETAQMVIDAALAEEEDEAASVEETLEDAEVMAESDDEAAVAEEMLEDAEIMAEAPPDVSDEVEEALEAAESAAVEPVEGDPEAETEQEAVLEAEAPVDQAEGDGETADEELEDEPLAEDPAEPVESDE